MSRRKKFWAVVSLAAALVVLTLLSLRWQAQWHLSAYRKKLIASGEKLTIEELAPKASLHATNTTRFLRLASTLAPFGNYAPTAMLSIKPGVARAAWREVHCLDESMDPSKPDIDIWPALIGAARTNEQTFEELQTLLDKGGIDLIQDYNQRDLNIYSYLPQIKQAVIALRARAMLALHQGRRQEAVEDLNACIAASKLLAENPLMIDQLVRHACIAVAVGGYWEALQAGGWTDHQLAELQRPWDNAGILPAAESSIAMERARAPMEYQLFRSSRQAMIGFGVHANAEIWNDFLLDPRTGLDELITSYPRYWGWRWIWSYQDEQRHLEFMQTMIESTRDAQKSRPILSDLKIQNKADFTSSRTMTNFDLAGQSIETTRSFVGRALRAQTVANLVTAAIALERFRLAHHVYPESLAKLTTDFVPAVPVDCMDGHALRYRRNSDGAYLLYSVGADGVDNGGDPTPEDGKKPGLMSGRDWVWPRAATAEEMQAYDSEQSKPAKRK